MDEASCTTRDTALPKAGRFASSLNFCKSEMRFAAGLADNDVEIESARMNWGLVADIFVA
ncbi:hypothetical protein SFMTTN_0244 [Sulfuriferula multivorans]|uniref:Uncharacterized protein n=1 Tax=Sulfuriferula multivorans TaxID=1559896 RepID=A0A401J9W3_9PROT|nr:hypothetical protein SFMTTN_0244 [Sulfuriferula multivorans]